MISIEIASVESLQDVANLYSANGYSGPIGDNDTVLIAREESVTVAVVRLCLEQDTTVLRGMMVAPSSRRQKIGFRLLKHCEQVLGAKQSYCLPYTHLEQFYGQIGFRRIDASDLPDFLRERFASYLEKGLDVIAMRRSIRHQ